MAIDLTHINAALTRTGNEPITSFATGGIAGSIAAQNYENIVLAELSLHPWKQATKFEILTRIDPDVHGDPPGPWTATYQLPIDLVDIRTVKIEGTVISYEVAGDKLFCDAQEADDVLLHYIWRVEEARWPPWFREGIVKRLEAVFLRGIGERYREASDAEERATLWLMRARNRDSQQQTPRAPVRSPTLEARLGTPGPPRPSWMDVLGS